MKKRKTRIKIVRPNKRSATYWPQFRYLFRWCPMTTEVTEAGTSLYYTHDKWVAQKTIDRFLEVDAKGKVEYVDYP